MGRKANGKISNHSNRWFTAGRICLICNSAFDAKDAYGGAICPSCREKYKIKPRTGKNRYPCTKWEICKKCAHRVRMRDNKQYICDCLEHTGHIRDLTANSTRCSTFEAVGVNNYDDD